MAFTALKARFQLTVALGSSLLLLNCTGEIAGVVGGPGSSSAAGGTAAMSSGGVTAQGETPVVPPVDVNGTPVAFAPAGGTFKRLTASELNNTLKALLGPVAVGDLEPDTFLNGFAKIGGATVSISLSGVEKYQVAIEAATAEVFADAARRKALVGCEPQSNTDTACFQSFVEHFGKLAWRQPLTSQQVERETALAASLSQTLGNPVDGLRATTNAILLSPNFLYRLERGEPDAASGFWRFTGFELASRLSYFLTNSSPDGALLAAAEQGKLGTTDGLRSEAERLLAVEAGRESVRNFTAELFRLAIVAGRAKDSALFPSYTPALRQAMVREVPSMLEDLVFVQGAPATDLFTTRTTFVNSDLAKLYGLDTSGLTSDSWVKVSLPANGLRAGILGTGAFSSQFANQKEGSPTTRGKFLRTALLCQTIPDPPADVSPVLADDAADMPMTKRQRLAKHREQGTTCAGCHSLMDPLGLPLENFDAIGAYRETDRGLPIDVSGDFDGVAFNGPVELGKLLSQDQKVAACLVRNLYRYATGQREADRQEPVLSELTTNFEAQGRDLRKLMIELVSNDGFRYVASPL